MSLDQLADEYFLTINQITKKLESLNTTLKATEGLEARRKVRAKITSLESVLRQTVIIHHHLKNYDNKEVNVHGIL